MNNEISAMLDVLGYASLDELTAAAIPSQIAVESGWDKGLPTPHSAEATRQRLLELAGQNNIKRSLLGMGYSGTITPAPIRRNILENPAWYTAYTPYQPEISQGRLEALMTFQTLISELTGLPIAGASLLDEATAVAEAVALARRVVKSAATVILDEDLFPQSAAVVATRSSAWGIELVTADDWHSIQDRIAAQGAGELCAIVLQIPGANGRIRKLTELQAIADAAHERGALVIAACDPLALTLLNAPADWGADIVVGSVQRFGLPMYFGGPHAGYIAVREGLERQLPGRLVGLSKDRLGTDAYRLALQTREQHIRRERATSNICTSQVLMAVAAASYAVWHGAAGLAQIATSIHQSAVELATALVGLGFELGSHSFFDTLRVRAIGQAQQIVENARQAGFLLLNLDNDWVGISIGEDFTSAEAEQLLEVFQPFAQANEAEAGIDFDLAGHSRTEPFCTQKVFNSYNDETEFMRYLRTLQDRDYALDRGMIPLGSCTMKANPAAAMETISYSGFADLHPLATGDDGGYQRLITQLCEWLAAITGYDEVCVQPNAGSQGEYAGLLAIMGWHKANGQHQRDICLIPESAHGTNAASAAMAGLKVMQVATAPDGSIDMTDLAAKITAHQEQLAAIMVTYPSTHGVFESGITKVCEMVHAAGGQVFVDGANFNALMGLAKPGHFGADVSHLNLHKTFAMPHGGGGPGVGPVAVRKHLAPFLPSPQGSAGAVAGAPFGSAGILPISYFYIHMTGAVGLRLASQMAVLKANYLAAGLGEAYPILYTGASGLVAHECIIDLRPLTKQTGVSVDDVAKRLIDYGFHAPTMSFPVSGTLMVEPTESESLSELDRFIDAMLAIRAEIDQVAAGVHPVDDNPLHNAPHLAWEVVKDGWPHPYSREQAAFPAGVHPGPITTGGKDKYWPPVARIDNAYGDRNLVVKHFE
ncbi:MAG: aminomethyl-transferring glycine dehydrogenase [Propionibacteriaceae bacterium]|nr:aminomethyl-transferring glycine dehydrogenase [Propionibacteriaceae bacterium]